MSEETTFILVAHHALDLTKTVEVVVVDSLELLPSLTKLFCLYGTEAEITVKLRKSSTIQPKRNKAIPF